MKFKYKSYGADICIFDAGLAEILGFDLVKGVRKQIVGATGFPEDVYLHIIHIVIGSFKFKIEVGFMDIRSNSYGIVGQKGFFDILVVKFNLLKKTIELKPAMAKLF